MIFQTCEGSKNVPVAASFHGIQWLPSLPKEILFLPAVLFPSSDTSNLGFLQQAFKKGVTDPWPTNGSPMGQRWVSDGAFLLLFEAPFLQQLRDFSLPVLAPTHFLRLMGGST